MLNSVGRSYVSFVSGAHRSDAEHIQDLLPEGHGAAVGSDDLHEMEQILSAAQQTERCHQRGFGEQTICKTLRKLFSVV